MPTEYQRANIQARGGNLVSKPAQTLVSEAWGLKMMRRYESGCLPSPSVDAATLLQGEAGAFLIFFAIAPSLPMEDPSLT
jgi:hypothetical protein